MSILRIRCLRPEFRRLSEQRFDDVIQIVPLTSGEFRVSFSYGLSCPREWTHTTMSDRTVWRYVKTFLANLMADQDPFRSVQIDVPMFPSTLFLVEELQNDTNRYYHTILDAVELYLDSAHGMHVDAPVAAPVVAPVVAAPVAVPVVAAPVVPVATPVAAQNPDDDTLTESEEDDFADMPPLINPGSRHIFM